MVAMILKNNDCCFRVIGCIYLSFALLTSAARNSIFCDELNDLLGEAPMQTQAAAQICRKTVMGRTGIVELRLFKKQLKAPAFYVV